MARLAPIPTHARNLTCVPKTIERWVDTGKITGYLDGKTVLVDLDEIEAAFKAGTLRDPRRPRFSPKAKLVPLPKRPEVVPEAGHSATGGPRTINSIHNAPEGR